MEIIKNKDIKIAAQILKNGGLVAFPTETVFGLGVVFDNENSYTRLNLVKRRPPEKPYTLMLSDVDDIADYAVLNEKTKKLISNFMPGEITLITKAKPRLPKWCVSSEGTIGVRIPNLDKTREMIRLIGKPLLVPSANKSGEVPANTINEVIDIFENEIDAVVEGSTTSKTPSTIVLVLNEDVKIIREGTITPEQIKEALK